MTSYVPHFLAELSYELHCACLEMTAVSGASEGVGAAGDGLGVSEGAGLSSALLCGFYENPSAFSGFWLSGMAHLLVISGAHLSYIESSITKLCQSWGWPHRLISILFLSLFTIVTHGSAPVVRALIAVLCRIISARYSLHWPSPLIAFISGGFCLVFHPPWWNSQSLILSWLATLIITMPTKISWWRLPFLYIALIPFTWTWGYTLTP